jgi:hypothetical protein
MSAKLQASYDILWRMIFSNTFTFTKRQIGWLLVIGDVVGALGILALNLIRHKPVSEIGPAQQLVFVLFAVGLLIGLSLIPLGDAPA